MLCGGLNRTPASLHDITTHSLPRVNLRYDFPSAEVSDWRVRLIWSHGNNNNNNNDGDDADNNNNKYDDDTTTTTDDDDDEN